MEKMEIRLATLGDVEACLEIYNAQIEYEAVHGDLTALKNHLYEKIEREMYYDGQYEIGISNNGI